MRPFFQNHAGKMSLHSIGENPSPEVIDYLWVLAMVEDPNYRAK